MGGRDWDCSMGRNTKAGSVNSVKIGYDPQMARIELDVRRRYGFVLGRSLNSDQHYVGLANGNAVRARATIRVVPEQCWDPSFIRSLTVTPYTERPTYQNLIEEQKHPHLHAHDPSMAYDHEPQHEKTTPRLDITGADIERIWLL